MKWELDDNSRSGFQYLIFGVIVIGALVALNWGVDKLYPPLGPHGAFAHGYLIEDDGTRMIVADTTRGERIATGVLFSFAASIIVALVLGMIARAFRARASRWTLIAARATFVISSIYFVYAALCLPPREFNGMRDDMFIVWQRDVILGDLPWPKEKNIVLIPFREVHDVLAVPRPGGDERIVHEIILASGHEGLAVGRSSEVAADDSAAATFARERAEHLTRMMHRP